MEVIGELGSVSRSRVRFQESDSDSLDSNGSEVVSSDGRGFELVEDSSFWKDHNVQVVIRIRPLNNSEVSLQGHNKCIRQDSVQSITWIGHPESRFTFDIVADEHVSQEKLFKVAGVPMVENCVAGYNSCMFAYGQTGSGKTHTMLGDIENGTRRHSVNCGMTPRVFEYLFSRIQKEKEARREEKLLFICKCSFLEIYNEQILDLLNPSSTNLQIREDAKKGVHVENLKEFEVSSARDVMHQLIQGAANRKVAATNMNRASSRSHSVFTCVIESKWEAQGVNHHRFARLNLVDLAGSERQKSSGAEGDRLKEATNINKSLSTLGLVIMNLVGSSNKKSMHVPYRDSKLTFLLQDSLGGNSKTTIIANISPSNCCALETLSTLKFAQRAKFIRNNAVINEDASGDVLAMRMQIQQLKKEVSRLQGLISGGHENSIDNQHDSPGTFKWEGVQGSFSPLTFDKRLSQRKEYEAALVAAFRRDRDKSEAIKALTAAKEAAEQLATQRIEEVKGLKMRIKFREEGIKRLQAVNSGKLSAEAHLMQEKEELLKEIEVLRNQVDRNPEVTRFAMENLQLREELRRLQVFVDEGERDTLNEQITVLQDKLLEALDWKLMHEKDTETVQDRLTLNWESATNEENEFLRMQAIQNQREVESLRKNLALCLEAKEKLERHVDQLSSQIKEQRPIFSETFNGDLNKSQSESSDDQTELKTMVNAIAVASQREAEAHEAAIILTKENEELCEKIKVLIDDNNKLIELYDSKNDSEQLQHKLNDMHEENEKLLGLYEKAMQEKGELIKLISTYDAQRIEAEEAAKQNKEKLEELSELYEKALLERDEYKSSLFNEMNKIKEKETILCERQHIQKEEKERLVNKLDTVKSQLETTAKAMKYYGLLEKATFEVNGLWDTIKSQNGSVKLKQQELTSLESMLPEARYNKTTAEDKFLDLKAAAQKISSKYQCCNEREKEAAAKVESLSKPLDEKREELKHLKIRKEEVDNSCAKSRLTETELRNDLARLKTKYQNAEAQRKERETVLFAIDNNKPDILRPTSIGKASEMLKSEEERVNISVEVRKQREKIGLVLKEISDSKKISESLGSMIRSLESWIESGMHSLQEAEMTLKEVVLEKQMLCRMIENEIVSELPKLLVEYQECLFYSVLKEEEIKLCYQEVESEITNLEELRERQMLAAEKLKSLLEESEHATISKKIELELGEFERFVDEAKSLLEI